MWCEECGGKHLILHLHLPQLLPLLLAAMICDMRNVEGKHLLLHLHLLLPHLLLLLLAGMTGEVKNVEVNRDRLIISHYQPLEATAQYCTALYSTAIHYHALY